MRRRTEALHGRIRIDLRHQPLSVINGTGDGFPTQSITSEWSRPPAANVHAVRQVACSAGSPGTTPTGVGLDGQDQQHPRWAPFPRDFILVDLIHFPHRLSSACCAFGRWPRWRGLTTMQICNIPRAP